MGLYCCARNRSQSTLSSLSSRGANPYCLLHRYFGVGGLSRVAVDIGLVNPNDSIEPDPLVMPSVRVKGREPRLPAK